MCVCVCVCEKPQRGRGGTPPSVGRSHPQGGDLVFPMFMFYDHVVITLCMLFACIYIYALLVDLTFIGPIGHLCSQAHVLSTVPTDSACYVRYLVSR